MRHAPRAAAARGYVDPQPALMLRPSGCALITSTRAPAAASARGAELRRRAVGAVDHDVQPGERAALERAEQMRDVRVEIDGLGRRRRRDVGARLDVGGGGRGSSRSQLGLDRRSRSRRRACGRRGRRASRRCRSTGCGSPTRSRPGSPARCARNAIAGVDATPSDVTRAPSATKPRVRSASMRGPDSRVSRPTRNVVGADHPRRGPARARRPSGDVRSVSASPRTPSVPNRSTRARRLPLRVLRRLAGLLEAVLATLLLTRVTREKSGLLRARAGCRDRAR